MQGDNALDRLLNSVNNNDSTNYSVEEQIKSATSSDNADEILEGMSAESKDALFKATEIKLDDTAAPQENTSNFAQNDTNNTQNEPNLAQNDENSSNYALFNSIEEKETEIEPEIKVEKPKRKAGRPKKSENINTNQSTPIIQDNQHSDNYNPIMNQLVKDLIDNLRKDKYKINRFDNQTMEIIYQYIYEKF